MFIGRSTARKIMKEAGAKRVSEEAIVLFQREMNRIGFTLASRSVMLAKHAKRKTVGVPDVKLAATN